MSKQFKNLVSASGECHQTNALTGFASSMAGQVDKLRAMGSMGGYETHGVHYGPQSSGSTQQPVEKAETYQPQPSLIPEFAPRVSSGWADEFTAPRFHPGFAPPPIHPIFHPGPYMAPLYTPQAHIPAPAVPEAFQGNDDLAAAKRMVEVLRASGNPKFANSTFVDFIDQVAHGDLKLRDGTVVDREGKTVDWDEVYAENEINELLTAGDDAENFPDQMERIWNELRNDNEFISKENAPHYEFYHKSNAYIDKENILEIALKLLREGKDEQALIALEAEVRVNQNSSEGWRLLGQLHAQFDRDGDAIKCLEKGHSCDPFNLDSMMALGVSLANELDSVKAMEILKMWIQGNEKYFYYQDNVAAESRDSIFPDYDFSRLKKEVFDLFERAAQIDPEDPDVHVALGVLHNINRNYSFAVAALLKAVNLRPHDFASWNKLGATLANAGLSQEALGCYHQALALKPSYARAWSNLAIAHSNLEQYENASKFFLTAIQISPDCSHLWTSLVLALSHWQPENHHLHTLIERRDVEGLLSVMRDAPRISNLPEPASIDRSQVDALTQSLRSKLLLNEPPSKSV